MRSRGVEQWKGGVRVKGGSSGGNTPREMVLIFT